MKRIIVFTHLIVVFLTFCRVYGSDGTTDFMVMIQENRQGIQQRALTEISISNPRQFIYHVYDMLKKGKGVEQMKNLLKYTREKNWKQKDLETTCLLKYFEALDELNLSDFDSAEILLKNIIGSEGDIDDKQLVLLAYNALG